MCLFPAVPEPVKSMELVYGIGTCTGTMCKRCIERCRIQWYQTGTAYYHWTVPEWVPIYTGMFTAVYARMYTYHLGTNEIMYPFPNSNGAAIEVENGGNFILYFYDLRSTSVLYWTCDYLSMLGLKLVHVSKGDQGVRGRLWLVAESGDLWSWALHTKRLLLLLWECPWNGAECDVLVEVFVTNLWIQGPDSALYRS